MKMRCALAAAVLGLGVFSALPAHGALMITEAMPDPTGTDVDREWFEMYNSGPTAVDLTGYAVGDGSNSASTSTGEGMGVFPDGTIMQPGQVFIIAARAGGFNASWIQGTFSNAKADFEFANAGTSTIADDPNTPNLTQKASWGVATATLAMANGGDDLVILDPLGNVVDSVSYGGAGTTVSNWVDASNATIQRTESGWQYVTGLANATPGTVSVPEPGAVSLLGLGALSLLRRRK